LTSRRADACPRPWLASAHVGNRWAAGSGRRQHATARRLGEGAQHLGSAARTLQPQLLPISTLTASRAASCRRTQPAVRVPPSEDSPGAEGDSARERSPPPAAPRLSSRGSL